MPTRNIWTWIFSVMTKLLLDTYLLYFLNILVFPSPDRPIVNQDIWRNITHPAVLSKLRYHKVVPLSSQSVAKKFKSSWVFVFCFFYLSFDLIAYIWLRYPLFLFSRIHPQNQIIKMKCVSKFFIFKIRESCKTD